MIHHTLYTRVFTYCSLVRTNKIIVQAITVPIYSIHIVDCIFYWH